MLVLSRKQGERIRIGSNLEVTVLSIRGDRVKLGFTGPPQIRILRTEVCQRRAREDHSAAWCCSEDVDVPAAVPSC